jgi:hypothetical protein
MHSRLPNDPGPLPGKQDEHRTTAGENAKPVHGICSLPNNNLHRSFFPTILSVTRGETNDRPERESVFPVGVAVWRAALCHGRPETVTQREVSARKGEGR